MLTDGGKTDHVKKVNREIPLRSEMTFEFDPLRSLSSFTFEWFFIMAEASENQLPSGYDEDFVNAVED